MTEKCVTCWATEKNHLGFTGEVVSHDVKNAVRGFLCLPRVKFSDSKTYIFRSTFVQLKIQTRKKVTWTIMNSGAILLGLKMQSPAGVIEDTYRQWTTLQRSTSCFSDNLNWVVLPTGLFSAAASLSHYTVWGRWCLPWRWSRGKLEVKWGVLCPLCRAGPRRTLGSSGPSLADWPTCFHLLANCRRSIAAKLPALAGKTACR